MKLYTLMPIFLALLAVGGCTQGPTPTTPTDTLPTDTAPADTPPLAPSDTVPTDTEPIAPSDTTPTDTVPISAVKEFTITAKRWDFTPSTITVNEGDTVKLNINSIDVTHGFGLSAFGINERLNPGQTVDIEFVADKKGTFSFSCTVSCGSGHGGMRGQLIVE